MSSKLPRPCLGLRCLPCLLGAGERVDAMTPSAVFLPSTAHHCEMPQCFSPHTFLYSLVEGFKEVNSRCVMGHVGPKCPSKTLESIISANIYQKTQFPKVGVRWGTASMLQDVSKPAGL